MNDDELDAALRRYTAIAPQASLRERVLRDGTPRRVALTWLDWSLGAAAILLTLGAAVTDPDLSDAAVSDAQLAWEASVNELAGAMGGGDEAVAYAQRVVPRPEIQPPVTENEDE